VVVAAWRDLGGGGGGGVGRFGLLYRHVSVIGETAHATAQRGDERAENFH
jgi:hypothetical protein